MTHRLLIFPSGMCSVDDDGRYLEFGNGHVVRCINLARELVRQEPDIEIMLGVSGPEASIARRVAKSDKFSIVEIPELTGNSSFWEQGYRIRYETNLIKFLEPSLVVSDTHLEALIAAKYNSARCAAILDLPPIEYFHVYAMLADLVLVPLVESPYQLPTSLNGKANFVGPILDASSLDSAKNKSVKELREEIGIEGPFILVYLSRIHADRRQFLESILKAYKTLIGQDSELVLVLIGPAAELVEELEKGAGKIIALEFVDNIHKYVKACSAFVTRSPIIAMEGLTLGKKSIIIPIPSDYNQSTMAMNLGKHLTYLPFDSLQPERLAMLIKEALNEENDPRYEQSPVFMTNGTSIAARKIVELVKAKVNST